MILLLSVGVAVDFEMGVSILEDFARVKSLKYVCIV